jgi:hypothetical protein
VKTAQSISGKDASSSGAASISVKERRASGAGSHERVIIAAYTSFIAGGIFGRVPAITFRAIAIAPFIARND